MSAVCKCNASGWKYYEDNRAAECRNGAHRQSAVQRRMIRVKARKVEAKPKVTERGFSTSPFPAAHDPLIQHSSDSRQPLSHVWRHALGARSSMWRRDSRPQAQSSPPGPGGLGIQALHDPAVDGVVVRRIPAAQMPNGLDVPLRWQKGRGGLGGSSCRLHEHTVEGRARTLPCAAARTRALLRSLGSRHAHLA